MFQAIFGTKQKTGHSPYSPQVTELVCRRTTASYTMIQTLLSILVRAECVRQRNEVAIILGIILVRAALCRRFHRNVP